MPRDNTPRTDRAGPGPSRRDVLRRTAAATAVGLSAGAFAGTGAAQVSVPQDAGGVGADEVVTSLTATGGDVLAALSETGVLPSASPADLPTHDWVRLADVAANHEGTAVVRGSDDVLRYVTVTGVDAGVLTVTVEPERDRAYAHLELADGGTRLLYDPDGGLYGVESDGGVVTASCTCSNVACSDGSRLEECQDCHCGTDCGPPDYCCCTTTYGCC